MSVRDCLRRSLGRWESGKNKILARIKSGENKIQARIKFRRE
jgi:hypothetical protein